MNTEKDWVGDLILLRGLPGSGKSTIGDIILFTGQNNQDDRDGNYIFDATRLKEAHNDCQQKCAERMKMQFSKIVIANTFTQEWEMEKYFEMADRYRYRVHSLIVENRHGSQNIHDVPEDKLEQMKNRFEVKL
jgi:predicted kinase